MIKFQMRLKYYVQLPLLVLIFVLCIIKESYRGLIEAYDEAKYLTSKTYKSHRNYFKEWL